MRPFRNAHSRTRGSLLAVPVAEELVAVTGIAQAGQLRRRRIDLASGTLNEVGAALYSGDLQYKSVVAFRNYDDGWRIIEGRSALRANRWTTQ